LKNIFDPEILSIKALKERFEKEKVFENNINY
jgi:hypothetical protein